jgi:hypothetical protein
VSVVEWKPKDAKGLRGVDPQDIMQRVAEGELIRDIAKDYGVSRSAVSHYIADHTDKKAWSAVREQSIYARLEQAAAELQSITEQVTRTTKNPDTDEVEKLDLGRAQLTLACAREAARFWQWRAEKEFGHIFQTKPSTAVNIGGNELSVQLVSYAAPDALPASTQAIDSPEQSTD